MTEWQAHKPRTDIFLHRSSSSQCSLKEVIQLRVQFAEIALYDGDLQLVRNTSCCASLGAGEATLVVLRREDFRQNDTLDTGAVNTKH